MSGHKADSKFFANKRQWSKRKDVVLEYYLAPYLPKIFTQRKPVLIVDGFAGPGRFEDGQDGSPRIICRVVEPALRKKNALPVTVWCIEKRSDLFSKLQKNIGEYGAFAKTFHEEFAKRIPEIEKLVKTHSVFLYIDPFTNHGLTWRDMDAIFRLVGREHSVEVLLNFNVVAFARAACVALSWSFKDQSEYAEAIDDPTPVDATVESLDAVIGHTDWHRSFKSAPDFPAACESIKLAYMSKLRERFREVCAQEIKELHKHRTPKYLLVYGSRSPKGLLVMNDAMAQARVDQAMFEEERTVIKEGATLFTVAPTTLVPDTIERLPSLIYRALSQRRMTRGELKLAVVRLAQIGEFSTSDIANKVGEMVKGGAIDATASKSRLNDESVLSQRMT